MPARAVLNGWLKLMPCAVSWPMCTLCQPAHCTNQLIMRCANRLMSMLCRQTSVVAIKNSPHLASICCGGHAAVGAQGSADNDLRAAAGVACMGRLSCALPLWSGLSSSQTLIAAQCAVGRSHSRPRAPWDIRAEQAGPQQADLVFFAGEWTGAI